MGVTIEFCGEEFVAPEDRPLTIGRVADVEVDDNPYLHRVFLQVHHEHGLWWLTNVGSTLTATVADTKGLFQAWLSPGARIPLALEAFTVWFTAGPTTYDFDIVVEDTPFVSVETAAELEPEDSSAQTTVGRVSMTPDQKLLVVALCESFLRTTYAGGGQIPSSAAAAQRLGWTVTKFNRKLDNVCDKLSNSGVRGLRGDAERLASNRRARLVEYAVGARLVTRADLAALPPRVDRSSDNA